ncbi:ABC-three component system protein [Pseudomonas sediminis]|uniref:ABC-three component system protein n=1 Tax=Pseudomonas sediminis TaxID=1691904 RepID=UPI0031CCB7AF
MQTNSSNRASAPGQYYGYSIQATRQCLHLLNAQAGSVVALEVLDDVDVVQQNNQVVVEQDKSGLATNPVSDWSVDLWKTFANWIDAIENRLIDLSKTKFHLYVVQEKSGELVDKLKYAHSEATVLKAVEEIRARYESEKPAGCSAYVERFLSFDTAKLVLLVSRFDYESGNSDPVKPIKDYFRATVPEIFIETACAAAIGWVKTRGDELIGAGKHPGILRDDFTDWLSTFCSSIDYDHLLTYSAPPPLESDVESNIHNFPTMMRQLDLIEKRYRDKVKALTDFMRAKASEVRWAEKGLIVEAQFKAFKEDLIDHWELHSLKLKTQTALTDIEKGRALHHECNLLTAKINNKEAPDHFSRGTFQYLSNEKLIGWHPLYKSLL